MTNPITTGPTRTNGALDPGWTMILRLHRYRFSVFKAHHFLWERAAERFGDILHNIYSGFKARDLQYPSNDRRLLEWQNMLKYSAK
jgi:hypothetical protein